MGCCQIQLTEIITDFHCPWVQSDASLMELSDSYFALGRFTMQEVTQGIFTPLPTKIMDWLTNE